MTIDDIGAKEEWKRKKKEAEKDEFQGKDFFSLVTHGARCFVYHF